MTVSCSTEVPDGGFILPDGTVICMGDDVNPEPTLATVCTGDKTDNIWCEYTAKGCRCQLDLMTYEQVWEVLTRVPGAKADLLRITDDECLIFMANRSKLRVDEKAENQRLMHKFNKALPYYTVMRGNTDGSII